MSRGTRTRPHRGSGGSVVPMAADPSPRFESVQQVRDGLRDLDYLADDGIAGVEFFANVVFAHSQSMVNRRAR